MDSPSPFPIVGIDVSKATLAVCYQVNEHVKHLEVSNSKAGSAVGEDLRGTLPVCDGSHRHL